MGFIVDLQRNFAQILRQINNFCCIVRLNILDHCYLIRTNQVDRYTLTTKPTTTTNAVDVILLLARQFKVDDQRHLLYINTTRQEICANQDTAGAIAEFSHPPLPLTNLHLSVNVGDRKLLRPHLISQPLYALPLITIDDRLIDVELRINVAESIKLPLILL